MILVLMGCVYAHMHYNSLSLSRPSLQAVTSSGVGSSSDLESSAASASGAMAITSIDEVEEEEEEKGVCIASLPVSPPSTCI